MLLNEACKNQLTLQFIKNDWKKINPHVNVSFVADFS